MKTPILKGASILTAILFFSMVLTPVLGGEVQPFNRWGYAYDSVPNPLSTQTVTAWVEGVSYGSDITGSGGDAGLFNIDTLGDTTDSPAIKTGAWNGDEIWYVHGELTTANGGTFFAESDAWIVGGYNTVAADLNYNGAQPDLLKINNMSSNSGLAVANDYIVIHNPTTGLVDIDFYSISIGVGAAVDIDPVTDIVSGLYAWNVNPIPVGGFLALDMGALSTTGQAVLLSHNPTGFIIDRAEYGAPAAQVEDSQPGTAPDNAANPAAGQEIRRTVGPTQDTNVHVVDFAIDTAWLPVAVLDSIVVTFNPVAYEAGDTTSWAMTAQGYNQVGGPMDCTPTWTDTEGTGGYVPNPSATGSPATTLYTPGAAPAAGTYEIRADDGPIRGTAVLDISWTLDHITVTPDPVTYLDTWVGTVGMTAQGYNFYNIAGPCTPVWTDTEGSATYTNVIAGNPATADHNADGTQAAGTYSMDAQDGAIIGSAVLQINSIPPVLTYINITPNPVVVAPSTLIGLTAQGYDQFWIPFACTPAWTDFFGGGSFSNIIAGNPATADYTSGAASGSWIDCIEADDTGIIGLADLTISGGGITPNFVWANKTGGNVRLEWSGGTALWEIYISNNVDGSGFNFAAPDVSAIANPFWEHVGVLGDGISYSYIVRGEGDPTNPNIAWKYAYQVQQPGGSHINWVSIPYAYEHTTLGDIGPDVGNAISWEIRAWSVAEQLYKAILYSPIFDWTGDLGYALQPGDAIMVFCSQASGAWDIVGSHDPGTSINIQQPGGSHINWVSLPFHHNYATLGDVGPSVGNAISWEIRAWSVAEQLYKAILYSPIFDWTGDLGYALQPGDAIMVFCSQAAGVYVPTTNPIGA